jgi:hypothetical protein
MEAFLGRDARVWEGRPQNQNPSSRHSHDGGGRAVIVTDLTQIMAQMAIIRLWSR